MNDNTVLLCKKRLSIFPSSAGMSLFVPGRESLVWTSRLGTGKSITFFLQCILVQGTGGSFQHQGRLVPLQAKEQRLQQLSKFHRKKLAPRHSNLALIKNVWCAAGCSGRWICTLCHVILSVSCNLYTISRHAGTFIFFSSLSQSLP